MKGIPNILERIYYTHLWLTQVQREATKDFSASITFSINFNVGSLGGMINIPDI
jgi:hypothetical protein